MIHKEVLLTSVTGALVNESKSRKNCLENINRYF